MADFIGIGAQKAGTSWLYVNLLKHPEVLFPIGKEIHYFDHVHCGTDMRRPLKEEIAAKLARAQGRERDGRPAKLPPRFFEKLLAPDFFYTEAWYRHAFSAGSGKKQGEITPLYSAIGPEGIADLKRMYPGVRLIYLIRDPLARMLSSMRMALSRHPKRPPRSFLRNEMFLRRGDYRDNIPLWDAAFGGNVLYVPFGHIRADPESVMASVERFIGVQPFSGYPKLREVVHGGQRVPLEPEVIEAIRAQVGPQYEFLRDRFGEDFLAATA